MEKNRLIYLIYFSVFILLSSCSKNENEECNFIPEITTSVIKSHPCLSTGTIKIESPIEANYSNKLDKGNFQTSKIFENIAVGIHTLSIKDNIGCEVSKKVNVDTIAKSNKFAEVANILKQRCSMCHSGLNPQAGIDFTRICDVLNHWKRIQARAVEGNPSPMPPTGLISLEERSKLLEWINNGHQYEE
jgi:hypothetical protein